MDDQERELQEMEALAAEFALREVRPVAVSVDESDAGVPWQVLEKAAKVGLMSFFLPEQLGGGGRVDCYAACVIQERLSWGCGGIGNLITSNHLFCLPLLAVGTRAQQDEWLAPLAGGDPVLAGFANSEPDAGSDAACLRTQWDQTDDGRFHLGGEKSWTTNASVARSYIVTARDSRRAAGADNVALFLVRDTDDGLSFGKPLKKVGQRAIINASIFVDSDLPADRLVGRADDGFRVMMESFDRSRLIVAASAVGVAQAALDMATAYARERSQFGHALIRHQAVALRIADMAMRVEAARLLTISAARTVDAGRPVTREAAMAKVFASETAVWCAWAALQTLGSAGYLRESGADKLWRDAKAEEIEEGTSDILRQAIARLTPRARRMSR